MTATAERRYQIVTPHEAAQEPLEDDDELLDEEAEPQVQSDSAHDFDTCSPVAAATPFTGPPSRMLLKRSLSPNGHIDSVSVEIELGIGGYHHRRSAFEG